MRTSKSRRVVRQLARTQRQPCVPTSGHAPCPRQSYVKNSCPDGQRKRARRVKVPSSDSQRACIPTRESRFSVHRPNIARLTPCRARLLANHATTREQRGLHRPTRPIYLYATTPLRSSPYPPPCPDSDARPTHRRFDPHSSLLPHNNMPAHAGTPRRGAALCPSPPREPARARKSASFGNSNRTSFGACSSHVLFLWHLLDTLQMLFDHQPTWQA